MAGKRDGRRLSRRQVLGGMLTLAGIGGLLFGLRRRIINKLAAATQLRSFAAPPPVLPHDPAKDRVSIYVAQGGTPPENIDAVLAKLGGIERFVGPDDVVVIKVSAQWWNQGMTNVAAVKRTIERVLAVPGFRGEVVVFENTHFRLADGSGLSRAWVHPSERNVDVPGWNKLGDLAPHFREVGAPVSFVGLVDAGHNELAGAGWHDPQRSHGVYGGDGRGPIAPGDSRDGYHWDSSQLFRVRRSWFDEAKTPLTWPRFTSPHSGLVVDLRDGVAKRDEDRLVPVDRKLTWINMTTANEHGDVGFTGACKSTMGVVDMSAGRFGTHPQARGYRSVHFFGSGDPDAMWRMAGPLAHFARKVRAPDLIITVAEWVGFIPSSDYSVEQDIRLAASTAAHRRTVVAGTDPVAIDTWCCRNLFEGLPAANRAERFDLNREDAEFNKFLRYYRQVYSAGTMDPALIQVV